MHKLTLLLGFLFPLTLNAQVKPPASTELAVNVGHAFDNRSGRFDVGGAFRGHVSLLRSRGALQYGLTIEGAVNGDLYLAPGVLANYRILQKSGYWYAGAMAGYNFNKDFPQPASANSKTLHGFVFGLQGGYSRQLGKRLAFNAEAGVRSSVLWRDIRDMPWSNIKRFDHGYKFTEVVIYLPVTIGIRYRLGT